MSRIYRHVLWIIICALKLDKSLLLLLLHCITLHLNQNEFYLPIYSLCYVHIQTHEFIRMYSLIHSNPCYSHTYIVISVDAAFELNIRFLHEFFMNEVYRAPYKFFQWNGAHEDYILLFEKRKRIFRS